MRVAVFDSHAYDRSSLLEANREKHDLVFIETRLNVATVDLAKGFRAVSCFVNDRLDREVLRRLRAGGTELVVLRSAGYNHVDLAAAETEGIVVTRVPEYSPHAVAEHAVALLLTLVRKTHKAYNRVHESNFTLDGLVGFDIAGKTVGVVGTGKIGRVFAKIMRGFDAEVIAYDAKPALAWASSTGVTYVDWKSLIARSDIVSLHVPLDPSTRHLLSKDEFESMKLGAVLINTGRGALIDTKALIAALKTKKLGGAALDVYEEEEGVFFSDLSNSGVDDDLLARLMTFPNVLITSHQAFFTREALAKIAEVTIQSLSSFDAGRDLGTARLTKK